MKFTQTEEPINESELDQFEQQFGLKLPKNYRALILKFNGGYTEESDKFDTLKSIKYGSVTVESTIQIHQIWEQNIPKGYLPIANDASDNPITLCLNDGENHGKIYTFLFDVDQIELTANSLEELLGVSDVNEL